MLTIITFWHNLWYQTYGSMLPLLKGLWWDVNKLR